MGYHHDRLVEFLAGHLQKIDHFIAGPAVQISCRLVAEQERRFCDKRPRDRNSLLLSAGEVAGIVGKLTVQFQKMSRPALPEARYFHMP